MNSNNILSFGSLRIPTREEFHKEYAGDITLADFDTNKPNTLRLKQLMKTDKFNNKIKKGDRL